MLEQDKLRLEKRELLYKKGGVISYPKEDDGETLFVVYHIGGKLVAKLEMYQLQNENIFVIDSMSSDIKGLGKHLIYDALNKVYPSWLCMDREVVTDEGAAIWGKFGQVYYVEQGFLSKHLLVFDNGGEKPNTYGVNTMFRYSRKTASKAILSDFYGNGVDYSKMGNYNPKNQECVCCGEGEEILITHNMDICHNCGNIYT